MHITIKDEWWTTRRPSSAIHATAKYVQSLCATRKNDSIPLSAFIRKAFIYVWDYSGETSAIINMQYARRDWRFYAFDLHATHRRRSKGHTANYLSFFIEAHVCSACVWPGSIMQNSFTARQMCLGSINAEMKKDNQLGLSKKVMY